MRLQEIIDQRAEQMLNQYVEENKMLWLAQGDTQGFDRGSRDKALQTARSFLAMGLSAQQVAEGTGLSVDEVQQLR